MVICVAGRCRYPLVLGEGGIADGRQGNWFVVVVSCAATGIVAFVAGIAVAGHPAISAPPSPNPPQDIMPNSMTAGFDDGDAPASDSAEMMAMADKISKAVAADQLKAAADSMNAESNVGGLGDAGASPGFDMQMNERHMIELLELSCEQSEYNCTEANYFAGNTTRNTLVDHCTGKSVNFL